MKLTKRIEKVIEKLDGNSILDLGCVDEFTGDKNSSWDILINSKYWLHGHLRNTKKIVYGVDILESQINNLKKIGFENLYVQDVNNLELNRKFDYIIAGELIEHITNFEAFFNGVKNHLEQNGKLIITTPYVHSLAYVLYSWFKYPKTNHNFDHTVGFCPSTLGTMANKNDFEIISIDLIPDYPPIFDGLGWKILYFLIRVFGSIFPKRIICNDMVVVLKPNR